MERAPAVINLTQKPQTKVNPTARFPLREALRLHEQKVLYREARTMAHRRVKKKKKRRTNKSESGRLWKTKVDEQTMIFLVVHQEDHFIEDAATVHHVDQPTQLGSRSSHVRERSTRLESRRTVKPDHAMASGRAYPVVVMSLVATPRVEDKQSIAYQNGTSYTRVSARHKWDARALL